MTDDNEDLPREIARMLRDVPPADEATVDAHVSAALAAIAPGATGSNVIRVDRWRRTLLAAAAAGIAVLGAGAGWAIRGPQQDPLPGVRATTKTTAAGTGMSTEQAVTTTAPAKASTGSGGTFTTAPPCIEKVAPEAVYLGPYGDDSRGASYLLFREGQTLVFVDKATCQRVWLSAVTTTP